jgi:hypothetical protein
MAFTDNCDLFGAVHENGANRAIRDIMLQRPSMFNYATADVAANRELWCKPIKFTSDVIHYNNPLFTVMPPIPVIGVDSPPVGLSFIVQVPQVEIDFFPGNVIKLPQELQPPLANQHFALHINVCGAIGCPDDKEIESVPVVSQTAGLAEKQPPPQVHLRGALKCFCLDVYVIGHFERAFIKGQECILGKVDDMDIVDIKPDELEDNLICYVRTALNLTLRQKLAIPLSTFFISFPLFGMGSVTLSPTPNPPIPNNPAVEDDQLKAFITMTVV